MRDGNDDLTRWALRHLGGITPLEIECLAGPCRRHVHVHRTAIERELVRVRQEALICELITAGASNGLIRQVFGLAARDLSRLRQDAGEPAVRRRRLKAGEKRQLEVRRAQIPPGDSLRSYVLWGLVAARECRLPLMSVVRYLQDRDA